MIILAIDPGYASLGASIIQLGSRRARVLHVATMRTSPKQSHESRMRKIVAEVASLFDNLDFAEGRPIQALAIEDQSYVQTGKLGRTNANAARARDVQHVILGMAETRRTRVVQVQPSTWRARLRLTGASDATIKRAVRMLCDGLPDVLSIHAAEAVCVGLAGAREFRNGAKNG